MIPHKAAEGMKGNRPQEITAQAAFQEKARQADAKINAILKELGLKLNHRIEWESGPENWMRPRVITRYVAAKGE